MARKIGGEPATIVVLGDRIKQARVQRGWSQERLAEELGVSGGMVSLVEQGHRPVTETLARELAKVLSLTQADFVATKKGDQGADGATIVVPAVNQPTVLASISSVLSQERVFVRSFSTVVHMGTAAVSFLVESLAAEQEARVLKALSAANFPGASIVAAPRPEVSATMVPPPGHSPDLRLVPVGFDRAGNLTTITVVASPSIELIPALAAGFSAGRPPKLNIEMAGSSILQGKVYAWFMIHTPTARREKQLLEALLKVADVDDVYSTVLRTAASKRTPVQPEAS